MNMTRFSIEDRYFSFNRTLLSIVGLWPFQKSKLARFRLICIISILSTSIIFELTTFITTKFSINLLIKVFSFICAYISLLIKCNSFYINSETVKNLIEQLRCIYNNIKNGNEIAIIETYGNIAKRYTVTLTMFASIGLPIIIIAQFWPDSHIPLSVNHSESHRLYTTTEYFIDKKRYYYLLNSTAGLCVGIVTLLATGAMLLAFLHHACGMFRIASYRIEHAIQIHTLQDIILLNEKMIHKQIVSAIDMHRKAMMFSEYLITQFEISFMLLIIFGVLGLSFNIFQIFQIISSTYNIKKLFMLVIITSINGVYMFLANFIGQKIIDHNNHIFATAYNIQWYITSVRIQKLIVLMLQRGNKLFGLNVGRLFVASLQCFATLTNASVSYFTVIYSMQ